MDQYLNSNGIQICYQEFGELSKQVILLIAGLGEQLGEWPEEFCTHLVDQGYRVIRYDNRDIGLSDKMSDQSYSLNDMAEDAIGLLKALKIDRAHVVGMSMGGMIAQILAAEHANHVASLCLIMSTTGKPGLPGPTAAVKEMLTKKANGTKEDFIDNWVEGKRRIDSPAYPADDRVLYQRATENYLRSFNPGGYMRHLNAIYANGSRVGLLETIDCPTLILHGANDPLIPKECGEDIAKHIRGSRLEVINGMGHNLPKELHQRLTNSIIENIKLVN